MRRTFTPNPDYEGLLIQVLDFFAWPVTADEWRKVIPPSLPPGAEVFVRWRDDGRLEMGIRKSGGKEPIKATGECFEKMPDAELKTWCGRHGVKYDDKPERGVLLARAREKAETAK